MDGEEDEQSLVEMNHDLSTLAKLFPRILPEVFREMLQAFDGDSRLYVVTEQLLKHQDRWIRGRWRTSLAQTQLQTCKSGDISSSITTADEFRRASYKQATRKLLYEEFKVLSKSKIEAVLAEENSCYSRARPTLQKLASKSWRSTFSNLIAKWRKPADHSPKDHYALTWLTVQGDEPEKVPILRETGNAELDAELHKLLLQPLLEKAKAEQELYDWDAAFNLNETEAKEAGALYECECCYSDTTFEQLAACTASEHLVCFSCIWHAVSEALFGQNWGRNIDHNFGQLKCIAPVSIDSCEGHIPHAIVRRALLQSKGGKEVLSKLEARLTEEAVSKSGLSLVRCPFCQYVEVDDPYFPPKALRYRLNTTDLRLTLFLLIMMLIFIPFLIIYGVICTTFQSLAPSSPATMFSQSLTHLSRQKHLSQRFQCRSPSCSQQSCLRCFKPWHDPHVCHESAALSLRKTVEAARTAALKRTCPRCRLGFIKDSGCNKLTCVCGYSMCYICRQGLGKGGGGEGYRHFCQHFRPVGGTCKECDKCDLYRNEDDEGLVAKAGVMAEKEWREKEGKVGVEGIGIGQEREASRSLWERDWTMQGLLDWWVEQVLTC
ncbi:hypothetical protein ACLMJK_005071 [Lecanora helva]